MWLRALVLATLVAFTAWAGHPSSPPVVDTVHGKVLGKFVSLEGFAQPVAVFLGIPFAKPPLGPLRFTPPQPAEPWSFVKNATSYPPMCSQDAKAGQFLSDLLTNRKENIPLKVSEDCLYLNIYTPADLTKKSRLPVLSPLAKNLFHRAISESGVALTAVLVKKGDVKPLAEKFAIAAGCQITTSAVMVHCLRQKTEDELLETTLKTMFFSLDLHGDPRESHPFLTTVIDGVLLPKTPEELQAERKFHTVPYMVGFNKQECGWIIPMSMGYPLSEGKLDQKTAMSLLWKSYPLVYIAKELIPEATEKYLGGTDDPVKKKDLFLDLIADVVFCVPSVIVARHHRDAGAPTYMYEFQYRPSFSSDMKPKTVIGDHGDELFSVFGAPFLKAGASEEEIRLSKMVMKFWANFARNGNPNGEGLPHWPEYNQKEGYLQIGANTQAAQKLKDKEVAFWTKLFAKMAVEKPPQTEHIEL
ncbi:PREDICTED: liver carboxylesterase 1-like isoform X3 [Cercocebus atys]|uniref:liver carboxylesterase 1-like isoform X3 n=1 Tax=Cercocebus atys TaxID=9531 RepID=UPI0005F42B34|nr:PREDICTED: liver carboxylesterase 1-like isoform X3 [Cercocebus atys]